MLRGHPGSVQGGGRSLTETFATARIEGLGRSFKGERSTERAGNARKGSTQETVRWDTHHKSFLDP